MNSRSSSALGAVPAILCGVATMGLSDARADDRVVPIENGGPLGGDTQVVDTLGGYSLSRSLPFEDPPTYTPSIALPYWMGICSSEPDGTVCDDGDACTQVDLCQAGVCVGTAPVLCLDPDTCHDSGACVGGVCVYDEKPDGTACNDDDSCTLMDTCTAGVCGGPLSGVGQDVCDHKVPGSSGLRWIKADPCPSDPLPDGWAASPLFPKAPIGSSLQDFCLYEWTKAGTWPGDADIASLKSTVGSDVVEDLVNVQAHADGTGGPPTPIPGSLGVAFTEVVQSMRRYMHDQFKLQVSRLPALPHGHELPRKTTVFVIDGVPTGPLPDPIPFGSVTSDHGFYMGSIVRDLSCPQGIQDAALPCASNVFTELALPHWMIGSQDVIHGGQWGTTGELSRAIHEAFVKWQEAQSTEKSNVLFNISVGRSPDGKDATVTSTRWSNNVPPKSHADLRALYHVLGHLTCFGAGVIAAAGNEDGNSATHPGATYPARWGTIDAPAEDECASIIKPYLATVTATVGSVPLYLATGSHPSVGANPSIHNPLVYPVAGLDGKGELASTARPGATPRLVAPCELEAPFGGISGKPLSGFAPGSGSSFAAAVVSGILATVWGYLSNLHVAVAMNLVYRAGALPESSIDADLHYPDNVEPTVRRALLCDAVKKACSEVTTLGQVPASCPADPIECPPLSKEPPSIEVESDLANLVALQGHGPTLPLLLSAPVLQQGQVPLNTQFGEKPPSIRCPACAYSNLSKQLMIYVNEAFDISGAFLTVEREDGTVGYYNLQDDGFQTLLGGQHMFVIETPVSSTSSEVPLSPVVSAVFNYVVPARDGDVVMKEPILVLPSIVGHEDMPI